MFLKTSLLFFLATCALATAAYRAYVLPDGRVFDLYKTLSQESMELRSKKTLERQPAFQTREGVQKDIWTVDGSERRHFRLKSSHSDLTFLQKNKKVEGIESLRRIECWIQDEPSEGMQQIRYLSAPEGVYHFPSHRFLAESVALAFFRIGGSEIPASFAQEIPFLTGEARAVSFSATSKVPVFNAQHVRAKFDPCEAMP